MNTSPTELPELHRAEIDAATVRAWQSDLEQLASIEEIQVKSGATRRAQAPPDDFPSLIEQMLSGEIYALQVRYRWQGSQWLDTLTGQGALFRLVRLELRDDFRFVSDPTDKKSPSPPDAKMHGKLRRVL